MTALVKMQRTMLAAAALALLPLAARGDPPASPPATGAPPAQQCPLLLTASLPMRTEPDGEIAVPASVDGRAIQLAVDTGDIHTVLSGAIANELQLERSISAEFYELMGGVPLYELAYAHSFKLGNLAAGRFGFLVAPPSALHTDTGGLLGPDVMSHYDVEFDFAHAKFDLFPQEHCPGPGFYWTSGAYVQAPIHVDKFWHVSTSVALDGKPITALIDSGADRSTMSLAMAKSLFGIEESNPAMQKMEGVSVNGTADTAMYRYPFAKLTLEGVEVRNPDIDLLPESVYGKGAPDLVLGVSILRQLRLYIAYKEQVLYATPAEAQ